MNTKEIDSVSNDLSSLHYMSITKILHTKPIINPGGNRSGNEQKQKRKANKKMLITKCALWKATGTTCAEENFRKHHERVLRSNYLLPSHLTPVSRHPHSPLSIWLFDWIGALLPFEI